jgi:hypothetical protein
MVSVSCWKHQYWISLYICYKLCCIPSTGRVSRSLFLILSLVIELVALLGKSNSSPPLIGHYFDTFFIIDELSVRIKIKHNLCLQVIGSHCVEVGQRILNESSGCKSSTKGKVDRWLGTAEVLSIWYWNLCKC